MANNKTAEKNGTATEKDLQAQLKQLHHEIAGITSTISNFGANQLDKAKHKAEKVYNSAKENGEEMVSQAKDTISDLESTMNQCIRKNPGKSVLFAAGIGFVLAQLLRR
ncbi:DUF883 family protein [Bartonella sp. A05]|uniref:DUF883 family protein n=1 Tax=Bartonella sp. A05 TaxID=2967261 RepID=UPI0022A8F306|nr:DUF883 domain-containing protein [Bartonella sp. A05]MCZ2203677.1 DUF883 domain-containing protein [Bartonella sp. A05]